MRLLLLNGPNLDLLGTRNPDVYGSTTLADLESMFGDWALEHGVAAFDTFQSNHEGALIDRIHAARGSIDGIVFNPGAFTHTSYALHDAIEAVDIPTVEVHISNVEEREPWRRISLLRPACVHTVYGRGVDGYRWALLHLVNRATMPVERIRYGEDTSQFADLRLPGASPAPLVVLVHGGFWQHQWTFDTTESIAVDLCHKGFATLNVEYRRMGAGGTAQRMVADVTDAVTVTREQHRFDRTWALAGHSAGGQLAIVVAERLARDTPDVVITFGGVSDLEETVATRMDQDAARAFLGPDPIEAFSPVSLTPLGFPLVIAHGTEDAVVPHRQALLLLERQVQSGGHRPRLLSGPHGHFEYLDPRSSAWQDVAGALQEVLGRRGPS